MSAVRQLRDVVVKVVVHVGTAMCSVVPELRKSRRRDLLLAACRCIGVVWAEGVYTLSNPAALTS